MIVANDYNYIPHKPSPKQELFLRLACLEGLYGGRAGCGKSDALLMSAAQGLMIQGYSALLLRRTYADLSRAGALMDRAHQWWGNTGAVWSSDTKSWTFPVSQARVAFGYLENDNDLDRYQSAEYQFIGFDEQSQFKGNQFTYMFSRLRRTTEFPSDFPLRIRGATNPGGIGHKTIVERYRIADGQAFPDNSPPTIIRVDGAVRRVFVPAHAKDNPGLDWQSYELALGELTEVKRKQLRDGIWIQDEAELVYSAVERAIGEDRLPDGHHWEFGLIVDLGATNSTAFGTIAMARTCPNVYLFKTEEPPNCNTARDIARHIKDLDSAYHFIFIRGDAGALGKGYLEEMRKYHGIPITPVQKQDKRGYIELVNGALENGTYRYIRSTTTTWQTQARQLLWKDERRLEEMPGMRNHSCDVGLYGYREAKHYSWEPAEEKPKRDRFEQAELDAIDDELAALEADGCLLPEHYR